MESSDKANKQKIFDTDEEFDEFIEEIMWLRYDENENFVNHLFEEREMNGETTENFINYLFEEADNGDAESQFAVEELLNMTYNLDEAEKYYQMAQEAEEV